MWDDVPSFRGMFPHIMVNKFRAPTRVVKCYVEEHKGYAPIGEKLLKEIVTEFSTEITSEKLQVFDRLRLPVLVVWGDTDKILPIESMAIFEENLSNLKSVVIRECGHAMVMDRPREVCREVFDFVSVVQADPEFFDDDRIEKSPKSVDIEMLQNGVNVATLTPMEVTRSKSPSITPSTTIKSDSHAGAPLLSAPHEQTKNEPEYSV